MSTPPSLTSSSEKVQTNSSYCKCFDELLYKYDTDAERKMNCPACVNIDKLPNIYLYRFH